MSIPWLWVAPLIAVMCSAESGSSLRGAVEALQRRQRGHARGPVAPLPDYDAMYEFVPPPPGYAAGGDYPVDIEDIEDDQTPKYIVKLLDENERPPEPYEYKIIKKKSSRPDNNMGISKESAFRERSYHSDNDRLRDLFADRSDSEEKNDVLQEKVENDAEYALLLGQLWSKYKNNKAHAKNSDIAPQGVVKLYKEKIVKKRFPDNWGPIAFKRKRSPDADTDRPILPDYGERKQSGPTDSNYNSYDVSDDSKDDWREEYAIALQPLNDESTSDLSDDDKYSYAVEKRFPVSKRSSGPYDFNNQKKRFVQNQNVHEMAKSFRSSSGTDPRIIKDLSKIFGDADIEIIKSPVKRNTDHEDSSHDGKPPNLQIMHHNNTHERNNSSKHEDDSHEQHGHSLHHPGLSGKEVEHNHEHDNHQVENDKPIAIKKKSIDWSDYFGIDKRAKKPIDFVNDLTQDKLKKQYFDTFNKEVIYPLNSFRKHSYVKRNYVQPNSNEESETNREHGVAMSSDDKRDTSQEDDKLDNIDKKLKTMEGLIVDEALHYSNVGEELDSKEEQEMKEKLLSRLAAAYSLEKMRKALKEFKQSLQIQKTDSNVKSSPVPNDEAKDKRVAVKKETAEMNSNDIPAYNEQDKSDDFEEEQGAGHYMNGKIEQKYSEGYMGGSGRHRTPVMSTAVTAGSCPVLARIVQRCRGVDLLAGDRGQLFLPLCSLHQICYLCGEAPQTTCDLVFLSEADTTCDGDMGCQQAARSALMALRELHDNLADELDGECEASPCLPATLKLNIGWQRAIQP